MARRITLRQLIISAIALILLLLGLLLVGRTCNLRGPDQVRPPGAVENSGLILEDGAQGNPLNDHFWES